GIEGAVGIVAGTDNDINNLSIVMTAREINPNLFVVIRKNKRFNEPLFEQFNADITMDPSDIIAHECLAHMISPLLAHFLLLARNQSNAWANQLISQLVETVGESVPETWAVSINQDGAPAVANLLSWGSPVALEALTRDPVNREEKLWLVPLLLNRGDQYMLLPEADTTLAHGDRILFCGRESAKAFQSLLLSNHKTLTFVINGHEIAEGVVWRWLSQRFGKARAQA
ncbi:MAG TPA: NAD-binding protein, partial [Methylophilaceae bacterium]|nr:NAD-binding protein [Methylophilaceae bacterium]